MTFDFSRSFYETGFPVLLDHQANQTSYSLAAIPENHDNAFVFTINDSGYIHAFGTDGEGLFSADNHLIARVDANTDGIQSVTISDSLLFALSGGSLYGFLLEPEGTDSLAQMLFMNDSGITAADQILET